MTVLAHNFATRLSEALANDDRTLAAIAKQSGYSVGHIRSVANRTKPNPTLAFVEVMALTLRIDPAWMLGLEKEEPNQ